MGEIVGSTMAQIILATFVTSVLVVITLTAILNVITMLRLKPINTKSQPQASVLIPARNESQVIADTLQRLSKQDYPNFEVILLDDHSTDGTGMIAQQVANETGLNLTILQGKELPSGWGGKNWACHQLGEMANGEILVFTDADVIWHPQALSSVVAQFQNTKADLLTVWPTQQTITWGERLVVPLMAFVTLGYLPHIAVHRTPFSAFAAANGQCMVFRRTSYHQIGGHATVKNAIVEDIRLAQQVKSVGLQLRMADGNGLVSCRMYQNWDDVRNGYAKNIIAGYGDSIIALMVASIFHWLIFLWPLIWLVQSGIQADRVFMLWAIALTVLGILIRMLTAITTRQRALDALLLPVSVILMTVIAIQATYWYVRYGGPRWKGRTLIRKPS